ncbi:hypothetical protein DL96DRAFT_1551756 [Flagelloscypha sp. PMI_526]|nr:hypothetical protein DL96DRAFT_1551756 [Flagelloscypha sp. PMI_526]
MRPSPSAHHWYHRGRFAAWGPYTHAASHTHTWANHYWHRPPSRIFWFLIGAVSAGCFIKAQREGPASLCHRPGYPALPNTSQDQFQQQAPQQHTPPQQPYRQWQFKRWDFPPPPAPTPPAVPPTSPSQTTPNPWDRPWGWGLTPQQQEKLWKEEMERVQTMTKQASEAMTELSEQTLDSVMKAVETLTVRLAAHQREKENQTKKLEEELKNRPPPRLV